MGFEKFGKISLTPETKVEQFANYLAEGKVMATRCKGCGTRSFPPRVDCSNCLASEVDWFEVKGPARLLTYTISNYGPTGFEDDVPYALAVAQLDEELKIFGRLSKDIKAEEIKIGMELKSVPVTLTNGQISYELVKA
jgi:uncharacterized OB-fold protein